MKWYHRTLSGVLAASMGLSLLGGLPSAAAADRATDPARTAAVAAGVTGTIQASLKLEFMGSLKMVMTTSALRSTLIKYMIWA